MKISICDDTGLILKLCAIAENNSDYERAFLLQNSTFISPNGKINIILKSTTDLNKYEDHASNGSIHFLPDFLVAGIRMCIKLKQSYIFSHTHIHYRDGVNATFSPYDVQFEHLIIKIAEKEKFNLPIVFFVNGFDSYAVHVYQNGMLTNDYNIIFPFSRIDSSAENIHLFENNDIGVIYSAYANKIVRINPLTAEKLKSLQESIDNGDASKIRELSFKYALSKWFGSESRVCLRKPERFDMIHSISKLEIMIQTGCNLRCKYCYANGGQYNYGKHHLSPEKAIEYIRSLIKDYYIKHVGTVFFFGGEPTAYPETIRAVCDLFNEFAKSGLIDAIPKFTMVSNGTYYSSLLAETIKKYKIELTISIDGPKKIHDQLRITSDGKGTFDTICENLKKIRNDNIHLNLVEVTYTTLHKKAGITPVQLRNYIRSIAGDVKVIVEPCEGKSKYAISNIQEGTFEFDIEDCLLGNNLSLIQTLLSVGAVSSFRCASGASAISLLCDGRLYPCHRFLPDHEYCLGSYNDGKWDLSTYSEVYEKICKLNKSNMKKCKKCWAKFYCTGCPAISKDQTVEEFDENCFKIKRSIERFILFWIKTSENSEEFEKREEQISKLIDI